MTESNFMQPDIRATPSDLPFFDRVRGSSKFVYFCRCYSLSLGTEVVVYTLNSDGEAIEFVYSTGRLHPDSTEAEEFLQEKLGPADDNRTVTEGEVDEIFSALRGFTPSGQVPNVPPPISMESQVPADKIDRLVRSAKNIRIRGELDALSDYEERFVVYDGSHLQDFGSRYDVTDGNSYATLVRAMEAVIPSLPFEGGK